MFRKRSHLEHVNGAALVYDERCRIEGDCVVVPGGHRFRMASPPDLPEDAVFTGAVRIVDRTRKITSRTGVEHRKFEVHLTIQVPDIPPAQPACRFEIVGVDVGVAIPACTSRGDEFYLPDEKATTGRIKYLKRQKARCVRGSRREKKLAHKIRAETRRQTRRRVDASRKIAAQISDGAPAEVAVEDLRVKNMTRSAKGTAASPGRNVAAKTGLNRVMNRAAIGRLHRDIERACETRGKSFSKVPAAGTSKTCHACKATGERETQALFRCPDCKWVGNADYNAAMNIAGRAWERRQGSVVERRSTRRKSGPTTKAATNKR